MGGTQVDGKNKKVAKNDGKNKKGAKLADGPHGAKKADAPTGVTISFEDRGPRVRVRIPGEASVSFKYDKGNGASKSKATQAAEQHVKNANKRLKVK